MDTNDSVTIYKVSNGYTLRIDRNSGTKPMGVYVFKDLEELANFIGNGFRIEID